MPEPRFPIPTLHPDLVDQPTAAPTRKLTAVTIIGALAIVATFVADLADGELDQTDMPALLAAVTVLQAFVGYLVKNRGTREVEAMARQAQRDRRGRA